MSSSVVDLVLWSLQQVFRAGEPPRARILGRRNSRAIDWEARFPRLRSAKNRGTGGWSEGRLGIEHLRCPPGNLQPVSPVERTSPTTSPSIRSPAESGQVGKILILSQ